MLEYCSILNNVTSLETWGHFIGNNQMAYKSAII